MLSSNMDDLLIREPVLQRLLFLLHFGRQAAEFFAASVPTEPAEWQEIRVPNHLQLHLPNLFENPNSKAVIIIMLFMNHT